MKIKNLLLIVSIVTLTVLCVNGCGSKSDNLEKAESTSGASASTRSPEAVTTEKPSLPSENEGSQDNKDIKSTPAQKGSIESDFISYENSTYKIKIKYPNHWDKQEDYMGTVVNFLAPREDKADKFMENVNLVVQDLSSQPMTLKQYTDLTLEQLKQLITNSEVISSKDTAVGGVPGYKIICKGTQGQYNLKWLTVYTIKNNKAYVLTFTAEETQYSSYSNVAEKIINSFEFKTNAS